MSLKQIAEMTGVSVSTVSRVLNDASSTCASKETREKIWAAAREIGYTPNEAARQLKKSGGPAATSEERRVTILLDRMASLEADPFFSELFQSLEVELMKQHATIDQIVYKVNDIADARNNPLKNSNGVILLGRCSRELLAEITKQNRNVVGIWRNSMDFDVDEVLCDGEAAARMAMDYLLSLGHSKIAYIGDCSYESRYVGYCNALIGNHISMNYPLVKETNQTAEEAEPAFLELLDEKTSGRADFTAVFCANDVTAIRALEV